MRPPRNERFLPVDPVVANDHRRHGRLRCEMLTCTLGEVMDLSASGMKVYHRGRLHLAPGDELELTLTLLQAKLPVKARVVRIDRVGFFRCAVGLEFIDSDAPTARGIAELARLARQSRVMGTDLA